MSDWWDRQMSQISPQAPARAGKAVSWADHVPATRGPSGVPLAPPQPDFVDPFADTESGTAYKPRKAASAQDTIGPCPNCGSGNYFSRTQGVMRGPAPAPHCMDCGHNGLYDLEGMTTTGAGGQVTSSAKQINAGRGHFGYADGMTQMNGFTPARLSS
jgi:hypothetical protein